MNSDKIQLDAFNEWWYKLIGTCDSCLMRDVLRNQKDNLREEWLKVRPMIDSEISHSRDECGRVKK